MSTVPTVAPHLPRQGETSKAESYRGGRKGVLWTKLSGFYFTFLIFSPSAVKTAVEERVVGGVGL